MRHAEARQDDITDAFARDGFHLARDVYPESLLEELEKDFDRIVSQLVRGGECINARWGGANMDSLDGGNSTVIHAQNVHRYSARWLRAFQDERFLATAATIMCSTTPRSIMSTSIWCWPAGTTT